MTVPIFEFRCQDCQRKFSALVGMTAASDSETCPHCKSNKVSKLVSRPGKFRSEDDRIDEIADDLEAMGEPDSPAEMRRIVRNLGKAMDDDMADEMEEMLEADLAGESEGLDD